MNNEPKTGELNKKRIIWWHKEKKVTQRKSKNKCRQLTWDLYVHEDTFLNYWEREYSPNHCKLLVSGSSYLIK